MTNVDVAAQLKEIAPHLEPYARDRLKELEVALTLMPMKDVLELVPGDSVTIKADRIGVSRNTFYAWLRGEIRPNKMQAKTLQRLTKIKAEKFQGRR